MVECVIVEPNLTGVCTVVFRTETSMSLSWPVPEKHIALTYRVSYPNITLNSSSSSAPNISFKGSEMPYVVQNLLAGATFRFWVLAFPSGAIKLPGLAGGPTELVTDEITCIDTTGMIFSAFSHGNNNAKISSTILPSVSSYRAILLLVPMMNMIKRHWKYQVKVVIMRK